MTVYQLDCRTTAPAIDLERDQSLIGGAGSLETIVPTSAEELETRFFAPCRAEYLPRYFQERDLAFRVVTHPRATKTCFEKSQLLGGWDPLDTIKALYLEDDVGNLYVVVIPETGCFVDRAHVATQLQRQSLRKAARLPRHMDFGTCSPFIDPQDAIANGGRVARILFDRETLQYAKEESTLDDFSFGLDHRMSLQASYAHCFDALKSTFGDLVEDHELLPLSFKEVLVRQKGRLKIEYEFNSLNYRTAKLLGSIHGHGEVTIVNDFVDELDLPVSQARRTPPRGYPAESLQEGQDADTPTSKTSGPAHK